MFHRTVLLLSLSPAALAQSPQRGGALPQPLPLFPARNWWNADISAAPVDSNSAAFFADVGATRGIHPDFGGARADSSAAIRGMAAFVDAAQQPLLPGTFDYDD